MDLETARKIKGLSQAALDDAAGLSRGTVSDIERGKNRNPSWETVAKIAKVIGIDPLKIFPIDGSGKDGNAA